MAVVILQNDLLVPPGRLLQALDKHGLSWTIVDVPTSPPPFPDLSQVTAVVALGGTQAAYDDHAYLAREREYLLAAKARGVPVLGICLGCQLLAIALGARGFKGASSELGFTSTYAITLTAAGLQDPVALSLVAAADDTHTLSQPGLLDSNILLFHSDTFELPLDCSLLASSRYPQVVAFRFVFLFLFVDSSSGGTENATPFVLFVSTFCLCALLNGLPPSQVIISSRMPLNTAQIIRSGSALGVQFHPGSLLKLFLPASSLLQLFLFLL